MCRAAAVLAAIACLAAAPARSSRVWWEETGKKYDYDLSGKRILAVLGDDFDYREMTIIVKYWEDWGGEVDLAGLVKEVTSHMLQKRGAGWDTSEKRKVETDLILSEAELSGYDALFFPGGKGPENLLKTDSTGVVGLIREADRRRLLITGICHGPLAIAASGLLEGRRATGFPDTERRIREAGGEYVTEVYVVDGNIITGNWPYFETFAVKVAERLLYPGGGAPSETSPFEKNPILRAIKERRSVRLFRDREVDDETVGLLLEAASWAPSADNGQPWRFVVVRRREVKERIIEALMAGVGAYFAKRGHPPDASRRYLEGIFSAPVHIFAFCDTTGLEMSGGFEEIEMLHGIQGVAAACQNILLAAHGLELGSLWVGLVLAAEKDVKRILGAPEGARLAAAVAVGYPARKPLPPVRNPLSDIMFREKWEGR